MLRVFACALFFVAFAVDAPRAAWAQVPWPGEDEVETPPPPAPEDSSPPEKLLRAWPFLYIEKGPGDARRVEAMFSLYSYFSSAESERRRVFPFYYSASNRVTRESWSLFAPLYFERSSDSEWDFYSLPLATGGARDERWWQGPPGLALYEGRTSRDGGAHRFGLRYLFDLVNWASDSRGHSTAFLSLLNPGPGETWFPLIRFTRGTGGTYENRIFPIYSKAVRDGEDGLETSWIVPPLLLAHRQSESASSTLFLPALGWRTTSPDATSWKALLGLWGGGRGGGGRWLRLEPFYAGSRSENAGRFQILRLFSRSWNRDTAYSAFGLLPPLGHFSSSPTRYSHRFAPFYFAGGTREEAPVETHYRVIAPFYFSQSAPNLSRRLVFPFYYRERQPDRGWSVLFPAYWRYWEGEEDWQHFFPLYSSIREGRSHTRFFGGPLYIRRREYGENRQIVGREDSFLWPLGQWQRDDDGWHLRALPLYWGTRQPDFELDFVAPLYLRTKTERATQHFFLPLYGRIDRTDDDGDRELRSYYAAGLLSTRSTETSAGKETQSGWSGALGLVARTRDDREGTTHSRLLPIWWRDTSPTRDRTVLFPLYYGSEARDEEGRVTDHLTLLGGNLWFDWRSGARRERGVLYPLTRRSDREDGGGLDALGLFSRHRAGDRTSTRLTPLFYDRDGGEHPSSLELFHLFSRQRGAFGERTRLMPFLYDRVETSTGAHSTSALFSLYRDEHNVLESGEEERLRWLLPFYFVRRSGGVGEVSRTQRYIFPLYYHSEDSIQERRQTTYLFPLVRSTHEGTGEEALHEFQAFGPLVQWKRGSGYRATRVFPFFDSERYGSGESSFSASLFYRRHDAGPGAEVEGLFSRDGYLGLELVREARGENTHTVAVHPLLFGYRSDSRTDEVDWNLLFLLSRYSRTGGDHRYSHGLLANGSKSSFGRWDSVFPFYYSHRFATESVPEVSLPAILHLYSRLSDDDESRWSVLGYLAHGHRSRRSDDHSFRVLYRGAVFLRKGSYQERAIWPFFDWEHDAARDREYLSLLEFVYIRRQDGAGEPRHYLLGIPLPF